MKKRTIYILLVITTLLSFMTLQSEKINAEVPYYTFTGTTSGNGVILTADAYTPSKEITEVNGEVINGLTHVATDSDDNIYITTRFKVYILDKDYNYVGELNPYVDHGYSGIKYTFVTDEKIYVVSGAKHTILIYDKVAPYNLLQEIKTPDSPLFDGKDGYKFYPNSLVVDNRGNMYINSDASANGLLILSPTGKFITFFGANPSNETFLDGLSSILLTQEQKDKMEQTPIDYISGVAIDKKGFIYTTTSTKRFDGIKKLNSSGTNYFNQRFGILGLNNINVGNYNNVYGLSQNGYILEFDSSGNLLFFFGGKDNIERDGLLKNPVGISSTKNDEIIVADAGGTQHKIQVYQPTEFANTIHSALDAFQKGNYEESKQMWERTLQYNSMFDLARVGLGDALMREEKFDDAYEQYRLARHQQGMSDSFQEVREDWLEENLVTVFIIGTIFVLLFYVNKIVNKYTGHMDVIYEYLGKVRKVKLIDELLYVFTFLRHPLNGYYELKSKSKSSYSAATILYLMMFIAYITSLLFTSDIFIQVWYINVPYNAMIYVTIFLLWLISNYLVCQISDGEGTFKNTFIATAYALSPIIFILPLVTIISHGLSLDEMVFYTLPRTIMIIWCGTLMFFMIKDIHNYEVFRTIIVIFKTGFTMLVAGIFVFLVYSLAQGYVTLALDIIKEATLR